MSELKPCPFCGSPAHLAGGKTEKPFFWVGCDNMKCMANTQGVDTPEKAIEIWNRRVKHDDQA